jgi:class 3 adenylate cyclase
MGDAIVEVCEPGRTPLRVVVAGPLAVGRDCDGLLLGDQQVSRRHVELRSTGRGVEVTDLGSTNGTFLDGVRFTGSTILAVGATLRLGATTITSIDQASSSKHRLATMTTLAPSDDLRRTAIDQVSELASRDLPTLADQEHHHGTITIVFSDIEGSTERVSAVGDEGWFQMLAIHNEIVRTHVRRFGGTEVKNQGDGFMLSFPSARRAVQAMSAVQRDLSDAAMRVKTEGMRIRIGMHTGEVIVDDDGDLFGRHVHMASRVASTAVGGEIVVSSLTKALLETRGDIRFGTPREVQLKGIAQPQDVHPIIWALDD